MSKIEPINIEPGVYDDLDINTYHNSDGISASGISLILDCPQRYHYEYTVKRHTQTTEEPMYKTGRAVHMAALEPEKFNNAFYCMDKTINLTTKIGKATYKEIQETANGREIIKMDEAKEIMCMAKNIQTQLQSLNIYPATVEQSIFWRDETSNALLKSRPDIYNDNLLIDVKTTGSIKNFSNSMYNYGYHRQAAMQIDALKQIDDKKRTFGFIVVEKQPPYLTAYFILTHESIRIGQLEYLEGAALYAACKQIDVWPGYTEKTISLPKWVIVNSSNKQQYN